MTSLIWRACRRGGQGQGAPSRAGLPLVIGGCESAGTDDSHERRNPEEEGSRPLCPSQLWRQQSSLSASPRAAAASSWRARWTAVLITAVCENACGKLPRRRFDTGLYSSASRSRSFLMKESSRSNSFMASARRPIRWRLLASQKLHARKTPSPGGNPSVLLRVRYR
jgi:hypothetical protein